MGYFPTTELEYARVARPEPTNREQRRRAVKDPCWYRHEPEWWQRRAWR
jgi:hypothetical protein